MTHSFVAVLLILALAALGSLSIVWSAGQTPTLGASDPCPLAQYVYRIDAGFERGSVQHGAVVVITIRVGNAVVALQQAAVGDGDVQIDTPLLIRLAALSAMRLMRLTP